MAFKSRDWHGLLQQVWLANALDGLVVIEGEASDDFCQLMFEVIRRWRVLPPPQHPKVVIQCPEGSSQSWNLAHALARIDCDTYARREAGSAGLWLFLAGQERICRPETAFTFHGNLYRMQGWGPTNEMRAEWLASRTGGEVAFWLELCERDTVTTFGAEDALAWGVATGVSEVW